MNIYFWSVYSVEMLAKALSEPRGIESADDLIRELRNRATPDDREDMVWVLDGEEWDEVSVCKTFDNMVRLYWQVLCENVEIFDNGVHPAKMDWNPILDEWEKRSVNGSYISFGSDWAYSTPLM